MRKLLGVIFYLYSFCVFAQPDWYIREVHLDCSIHKGCDRYTSRIKELKHQTMTLEKIQEIMKNFLSEGLLNDLKLDVIELSEKEISLRVKMDPKKKIGEVVIKSNVEDFNTSAIYKLLPFKADDIWSEIKNQDIEYVVKNFLIQKKIEVLKIDITEKTKRDKVDIAINLHLGKVNRVEDIEVVCDDKLIRGEIVGIFQKYRNKIHDAQEIKNNIDSIVNEYRSRGYYNFSISLQEKPISNSVNVKQVFNVDLGEMVFFHFNGHKILNREVLLGLIKPFVRNNQGKINHNELERILAEKYEELGVYKTEIKLRSYSGVNNNLRKFTHFYITIHEGKKIPLKSLVFYGNEKWENEKILDLYYFKATPLAKRGYVDKSYISKFSEILKEYYLKDGFIFVDISAPKIIFSSNYSDAEVEYVIREKQQVILEKININNLDSDQSLSIAKSLINQVQNPVNVVDLQTDLQTILNRVRSLGYYYAEITNANGENLLQMDFSRTLAVLNVDVKTGNKLIFKEAVVLGNITTQSEVILREIELEKDDLITPEIIIKLRDYISSTGLFSSVKITPTMQERKGNSDLFYANLLIEVIERDFGAVEIAPGYRTDIGVKMATSVAYNNLFGMNRSLGLKLEANQRLDYDSFDERRRAQERTLLEYNAKLNYEEPYVWGYPIAFDSELSQVRKRYYSFDADISRISTMFTKLFFSRKFSTSIRYRLEEIRPFDATELKDKEDYRIGSITPTLGLDLRDRIINTQKGAHLTTSCEYAHPAFLSKKTPQLEINFLKLVTRNKFYYTIGDVTIASFASLGYQKNLAATGGTVEEYGRTKSYIPSREVFRLDGADSVRGFDDTEINRLSHSGEQDIAEYVVDDKAFFANYKIEPRYMLEDNVMIGTFIDAGRVYVNKFTPLKVRTSVGISFKILTPVGTLDFDYGIKLKRQKYSDGERDSFGRFHLSIGHF